MRNRSKLTALFVVCLVLVSAPAAFAVQRISIATMSPGGGFYMAASALSTVVNSKVPGYELSAETTGASAVNAAVVQGGELEFGLCATETAYEAYNGLYDFKDRACKDIRACIAGWGGVYIFVTTDKTGIKKFADLEGKSWSCNQAGSSNAILSDRVFSLFGVNPKKNYLPAGDANRALQDGTLDGYTLTWPNSSVSELEVTRNVVILTIDKSMQEKFQKAYPQYIWLNIPDNAYKCLPSGAFGAGLYNLVISNVNTDEDIVYMLVKAAYENRDLIETIHPQFAKGMGFENIEKSTIPYHKGAIKYFKEMGVEVPDRLIPPEAK